MIQFIKFLILASLAVTLQPARGERLIGQDDLALNSKNFRVEQQVKYLAEGTPIGKLDFSFGDDRSKDELILSRVKPRFYRVHLLNATCVRNHNCGNYEPVAGYNIQSFDQAVRAKNQKIISWVKQRTAIYKQLSEKYPGTKFLISPALEHNLSAQGYRALADAVLDVWPNVQLVNSGMTPSGERYRGSWLENHGQGANTNSDVTSLDGDEATDINIRQWLDRLRGVKIQFVWSRSYNCRNLGPWEDPRARAACPKDYQFEELARITDERGVPPKLSFPGCKTSGSFQAPNIWKPLAEDKGVGDGRANLPVLISPFKTPVVEAITYNGKTVAQLGLYGAYQNGLMRHYSAYRGGSGVNGYEIEKRARAASESNFVWLKSGGQCLGPILAGRRQGSMR